MKFARDFSSARPLRLSAKQWNGQAITLFSFADLHHKLLIVLFVSCSVLELTSAITFIFIVTLFLDMELGDT